MSDSNRSSAPRTQHAALTPHSQVTDGGRTRIWRYHKPLHSLFCHSHSIPGTTRTRIRWLEATQSCPIDLRRHIKWSTAGFDPASSACKADVLPNELRPQSCRERNRTDMKRHVTTPLSRSATLQNIIGTDGLEPPTSVSLTCEADTLIRT